MRPARTQPERLPLAVGAGAEWIEAYGPLQADAATVQGEDWAAANRCVEAALDALISPQMLESMRERFRRAESERGAFMHNADGWAHLEQLLGGFDAHGLRFPASRMDRRNANGKRSSRPARCPVPIRSLRRGAIRFPARGWRFCKSPSATETGIGTPGTTWA